MSSGPELGSVAPPARIIPNPWPTTQMTAAVTNPRERVARESGFGKNTPIPTATKTTAKARDVDNP